MRSLGSTILSAALLVGACAQHPAPRIVLDDGAGTPTPSFLIHGPEAPVFITVEHTADEPGRTGATTVWRLVRRRDTTVTMPVRVVYGVVPPGYQAGAPAALLSPARYRLTAKLTHEAGSRPFTVTADGQAE